MALLLAKQKWNQGYVTAREARLTKGDDVVICKSCKHVLSTNPITYYRCGFAGLEGRFRCDAGGTCTHAEPPDWAAEEIVKISKQMYIEAGVAPADLRTLVQSWPIPKHGDPQGWWVKKMQADIANLK